jgi:hypothetical protein
MQLVLSIEFMRVYNILFTPLHKSSPIWGVFLMNNNNNNTNENKINQE